MRNPFNREPALTLNLLLMVATGLGLIFHLSDDAQGILQGIASAIVGLLVAGFVKADQWVPIVVGIFKLLISLVMALGVDFPAEWQAFILMAITAVLAFATRQSVVAPVDAAGRPQNKLGQVITTTTAA